MRLTTSVEDRKSYKVPTIVSQNRGRDDRIIILKMASLILVPIALAVDHLVRSVAICVGRSSPSHNWVLHKSLCTLTAAMSEEPDRGLYVTTKPLQQYHRSLLLGQ